MATPTLDAYRRLNPQLADRSDDELLDQLSEQLQASGTIQQYPDVTQALAARDREYRISHTNPLREFTHGISSGVDTAQAQAYSQLGQVGDFLGLQGVKNFGLQGYQRNVQEAAQNRPAVSSVGEVSSPKEALLYGAGLIGQQVPALAETAAATAAGGLAGEAIGPEGAVGGALVALGSSMGAKRAVDAARLAGSTLGLAGAGYEQSQNYGQLASEPGAQNPALTSAVTGAVGGLLMTIVPSKVLRSAFGAAATPDLAEMGISSLLARAEQRVPGLAESILKGVGEHGTNNALLGVANELTSMAGEMYAHRDDPSFSISDKDITDRILNGVAAGGLIGAAFGAYGANGERNELLATQTEAKARAKVIQDQKDAEAARSQNRMNAFVAGEGGGSSQFLPTEIRNDQYAALFDEAADKKAKDQARQAYNEARTRAFYGSDRAAELLRNQLSEQAGGTEIKPVDMRPQPPEDGSSQPAETPPTAPTPSPETLSYQYTHQAPQEIEPGVTVPGYLQIDTFDSKGNNLGSHSLEDARKINPGLPDVPPGLASGRYTLQQIQDLQKNAPVAKFQLDKKQDGPFVSPLPRRLETLINAPRGGITPSPTGDIPTKSFNNLLKRLGASDDEIALYKQQGLDELTQGDKVNLPRVAQWMEDHAPKVEVKELSPVGQLDRTHAEVAQAQHRLESQGFTVDGDGAVYEPHAQGGERILDAKQALDRGYGESAASDIDLILQRHPGRLTSDAATGRYGVEPKLIKQMPGAVDLLVRLPSQAGHSLNPEGTEPLFRGPHFGESDKNVVASVRAYREGDTLHVFEVQSDWAQKVHKKELQRATRLKGIKDEVAANIRSGRYHFSDGTLWDSPYAHDRELQKSEISYGSSLEEAAQNYITMEGEDLQRQSSKSHPLLKDYETIALKAAINYAQAHGLKKIALSDAETAMMTEGHDKAASVVPDLKVTPKPVGERYEYNWKFKLPDGWSYDENKSAGHGWVFVRDENHKLFAAKPFDDASGGPSNYHELDQGRIGSGITRTRIFVVPATLDVPQEKGMRLHYDERLPRIASKLTGDTHPEKVDYGWHKNATNTSGILEGSPAFKNPQTGEPKANITARVYRLDKVEKGQRPLFDGPRPDPKLGFAPESLGEFSLPEHMEHGGDLPLEPQLKGERTTVPDIVPPMRKEMTKVSEKAFPDEVEKTGREGLRKEEDRKTTTKRLVAVKDNETGRVTLMPVYRSTGDKLRVDNGVEAKVTSRQALAAELGMPTSELKQRERYGGADLAPIDRLLGELRSGSKKDEWLGDIAKDTKRTVIGFVDMNEPAQGRHFTFNTEDQFRGDVGNAELNIEKKGSGGFGVPEIIKRLTDISPEDSRAVQSLASLLEQTPEAKALHNSKAGDEGKLVRNANNIIRKLLVSPRSEKFNEDVANIKTPGDVFAYRKGKMFGLFTPEQWTQFKVLIDKPGVTAEDLHNFIDAAATQSWPNKMAFINSVVPSEGETQMGRSYDTMERQIGEEDDNLSAQAVEAAGREGSTAMMQAAERQLSERQTTPSDFNEERGAADHMSNVPEAAMGVAGLSKLEIEGIARVIQSDRGDLGRLARNVREARADSEISTPHDDIEFQAVKNDLKQILDKVFEATRGETLTLSDDFLYGIYSNLDKVARDSQPMPDTYRVVNDAVNKAFTGAVQWLAGRGVDVRLVQRAVDSQIEFLQKEWGRSISYEDGRRLVVLSMQDVSEPSRENLRVMFHEIAHQLFADEPVWMQRTLHDAVDRLSDLQMDVFSKTYDNRLKTRDLAPSELMEEVLAEHLAFQGVDTTAARSLGQKFIDGIKKAFYRASLAVGQLMGWDPKPHWSVGYMELRFKDMLDRALNPTTDFERFTATEPKVARYKAMLLTGSKYIVERFQNGQFRIRDVADTSRLAAELNLDNKLSFSDVVIRDNRADQKRTLWENEFGVGDKAVRLGEALKRVAEHPSVTDVELKAAAMSILFRSGPAMEAEIKNAVSLAELQGIRSAHPDSAGVYLAQTHQILLDPNKMGGFDHNDYAYLVVHEATHAAVVRATDGYHWYKDFKAENKSTKKIAGRDLADFLAGENSKLSETERVKLADQIIAAVPHFERVEKIFDHLQSEKFAPDAYGMKDLDEFMSEAMSNRTFQMQLAKFKLPDNLRIRRDKQSVFATVVELVSRMFNADKRGNALESVTTGIERAMLVADPLSRRPENLYSQDPYASPPVTQIESDDAVRKDFEYEYAEHNAQADFYHSLFDKAAQQAQMPFADYLSKILRIYNPESSIQTLNERVQGLGRKLPINADLRLSDVKGAGNQIKAGADRAQITRRLLATVSDAQGKMAGKIAQIKDALPSYRKDIEAAQAKFVRFENAFHDVTTLRDNALKILRKGLRGAERGAERMVRWTTRLDGLPGVAAELFRVGSEDAIPDEYVDLMLKSVEDHVDDFFITDALTAATKANIDFDALSPLEIKKAIEADVNTSGDERLRPFADNSPQAKADLALLIYYAKTAPEDMAVLAARVDTDPERKEQILNTIKKIVRGNVDATQGLSDLFKEVRKGDIASGKARQALTNAARQLTQAKKQLSVAELRVKETEAANAALTEAIKPHQQAISVQSPVFEPVHGATILLTPGKEPEQGKLNLGPKSSAEVSKIMMDNFRWLRENEGRIHDPIYYAIQDQADKLGRVAMDQVDTKFRDSFWTQRMGSVAERLYALGSSTLRLAGDRWQRYFALRESTEPLKSAGFGVSEAFRKAQRATGFEDSYQGFKDTFWNPGYHFLRHMQLLPGSVEENAAHAKGQLRMFFQRNEATRDVVNKPGAFDELWNAMRTNADLSKKIANKAAEWKVMVEDDQIKVRNPRTGEYQNALRPAMDVGLFTTQASMHKLLGGADLLNSVKGEDGNSLWKQWGERLAWEKRSSAAAEGGEESYARFLEKEGNFEPPEVDYSKLFTPEIIHHFLTPYVYDTSTLHFDAPALKDGVTKNKAAPLNVQSAWESAGGAEGTDVVKFANNLFDLEYRLSGENDVSETERRQEFVTDTLQFFQKQYRKISNLTEKQDELSKKGLSWDRFVSTPMMDSITSMDFPHEFLDYSIYDNTTTTNITSQLAAHASLGRDLGFFSRGENGGIWWELTKGEAEFRQGALAKYERLSSEFRAENPKASVKDIDAKIRQEVGDDEFGKIKNAQKARQEIDKIKQETLAYFTSPNGSTRELQVAQQIIGGVTGGIVNNFKTTLYQTAQSFEPLIVWGIGKAGRKITTDTLVSTLRQYAGSFIQGIAGQAVLASDYARFMNENNILRDPHNTITTAQVLSDAGKNNIYEQSTSGKILGLVKKGRSLAFDTGFRGAEGERIAPKFRIFAPFSTFSLAANQGAAEAHIRFVDQALKKGMQKMEETPGSRSDPTFKFEKEDLTFSSGSFDDLAFGEFKNMFRRMGTTMEVEVRKLLDTRDSGKSLGNIVIPPDLARLTAAEAMRLISLPSDVSTAPIWLVNNPVGRLAMPLMTWALNKTNQLVGRTGRDPATGELTRRAMTAAIASMALGMVPAAMVLSMIVDQYDEKITGKKSNLVDYNFDSPSQTAVALMERLSRVGTFGLAGDLVNGIRVYGTSGDLRGLSIDQRVVFVNELQSIMGLASTLWNQEGTLTYDTFYRPLVNTLGGVGILQNQQILNNITNSLMGVPIFQAEAETTARINALNYIRGAGRVTGLDVRTSAGGQSMSTPIRPWISEMAVAAYSNNSSEFAEAYQKALIAAREEGKQDPVGYVKEAFSALHPLRATFVTPPSKSEVGAMLGVMSDKGQNDVQAALGNFNAFAGLLGIQPYTGREIVAKGGTSTRKTPDPWAGLGLPKQ